jgi:hypothetical protein
MECYYCKKFPSTTNKKGYLKHVVNYHKNIPLYHPLVDPEKII